jgi:MFS family permease
LGADRCNTSGALEEQSARAWLWPLLATVIIQATAAFLSRLIPTLAPAFSREFGWSPSAVGYLAGLGTFGSILFLLAGNPLIRRTGPIRALQYGLAAGGIGVVLLAWPTLAAGALASLLIGLGYGPSAPAGSDILHRYAPARHRNLVFSIKQAGVPAGGVLAGLALPPVLEMGGWSATLAFTVVVALLAILAVQPLRQRIDAGRDPRQPLTPGAFLTLRNITTPLSIVQATPELRRLGFVGACLAVGQGCWISLLVTYLVMDLGLSLATAGVLFAIMQITGIPGRVGLGYLADRLGSGRGVLIAVAISSAVTSVLLAVTSTSWPLWSLTLVAGVAGVTVSSWNGLQVAEIARHAPAHLLGEAASGATLLVFIGYVVGPAACAALVALTGQFDVAFLCAAGTTALALAGLTGADQRLD